MSISNIKVRAFTGQNIKTYLPSIAKLRIEVLREYPDLYDGDLEQEKRYLRRYLQTEESIAVIAFEGSTVVGASTGIPLSFASKEIQKQLTAQSLDPAKLFYFDESVLLKNHRGRGVGHHFFEMREEHVRECKKFHTICFLTVCRPEDHPEIPKEHMPLENFWQRRGYSPYPEIACMVTWKEIGEPQQKPKAHLLWMKELS